MAKALPYRGPEFVELSGVPAAVAAVARPALGHPKGKDQEHAKGDQVQKGKMMAHDPFNSRKSKLYQ